MTKDPASVKPGDLVSVELDDWKGGGRATAYAVILGDQSGDSFLAEIVAVYARAGYVLHGESLVLPDGSRWTMRVALPSGSVRKVDGL